MRRLLTAAYRLLPRALQRRVARMAIVQAVMRYLWVGETWVWRFRLLVASRSTTRYLSDESLQWIDPSAIVYQGNTEFDIYRDKGRVVGGGWDTPRTEFDRLDFYASYEQRVSKGTPWERLPYYRRALAQIESGITKWGCRDKLDLDRRCAMLDGVFQDIQENGYRSQACMEEHERLYGPLELEDEITVNIGRDGDLLFNNGRHRLTFAKIAGVEKVPVGITVRHAKWEAFKREIEAYAARHGGKVYAPLTHIDLRAIPSHHTDERFEIIRSNLGRARTTLLDIGAHWGYFCHKFEEEGFQCFAVENDDESLYFLRKLRRAENRQFAIIPRSVFALSEDGCLRYDVVLALAIFHHFLKHKDTFEELKGLLADLDVNELYFEPHQPGEPQMEGAFVDFTPGEFVDFILSNSCLSNQQMIGQCRDGRPVFRLWR